MYFQNINISSSKIDLSSYNIYAHELDIIQGFYSRGGGGTQSFRGDSPAPFSGHSPYPDLVPPFQFFLSLRRQGSVLSPAFFAIYIDDLLQRLRRLRVGCHIGEKFLGAAGFADDIVLLSASRGAMELMLAVCEEFAMENNLKFSTDPVPRK